MDKYIGAKLIQAEPERNPVTKGNHRIQGCIPRWVRNHGSPKEFLRKHNMKVNDIKIFHLE